MVKVSIVILNWNGGEQNCVEAVESALNQDYSNKEIIFVDNGSDDGSYEAVTAAFPELLFIQTGENLGCPGGRNKGVLKASGEIIAFLENDGAWKTSDVISAAIDFLDTHKHVAAIYTAVEGYESNVLDPPVDTINSGNENIQLSSTFRGGASFIRKKIFNECGMFPDDFLRQCEEMYVSYLIIDKGFNIVYWPEKTLRHKGSDYIGKSDVVLLHTYENELKTIIRLFPMIYLFYYLPGKMGINFIRLTRKNKLMEYFRITLKGIGEIKSRRKYPKISISGLKRFNYIKYNSLDFEE